MSKTLKTIQTLAKIGKILSEIIFVFCIVGLCLGIVGIIGLAFAPEAVKLGGVTLHGLISDYTEMELPAIIASLATGMLFCLAEAILCRFAVKYFKRELADGQPFTKHGAKELKRLGILTIVLPLITLIVCAIGIAIANFYYPGIDLDSLGGEISIGLGIMLIVMALFCRHGAEIREAAGENAE